MVPIYKFLSPITKAINWLRKKVSKSYKGSEALQSAGIGVNDDSFDSLYNSTIRDLDRNQRKHKLLITLFAEPTAKNSFKKDVYSGLDYNSFEVDLTTNLQTKDKYLDIRYINLKNEVDNFVRTYRLKLNENKTPQEIDLYHQVTRQMLPAINPESIDLSSHISDIVTLRAANKHDSVLHLLEAFKQKRWSSLSPDLKYKVTLNLAVTHFELDQKKEAAGYFIELAEFNVHPEEAIGYAALGYALLEDYPNAIKFAHQAIAINDKNETAYLALFFSHDDTLDLEDLDALIPVEMQKQPGLAINFAALKDKKGDHDGAFDMLLSIYNDMPEYDTLKIDLCVLIANNRIKSIELKDDFAFSQLSAASLKSIEFSVVKLTEAWDHIKDTDLRVNRSYILTNRGVAYNLLGKRDLAEKDLIDSLNLNKTYFAYRSLLILYLEDNIKFDRLLDEMTEVPKTQFQNQELLIFQTQRDFRNGNYEKPLKLLIEQLPSVKEKLPHQQYYSVICDIYLTLGNYEAAEKYAFEAAEKYPTDPFGYYYLYKILTAKKDIPKALDYLEQAKNLITISSPRHISVVIADEYLASEDYDSAIYILEKIAATSIPSPITKRLIIAYYHSGRYKTALETIEPLVAEYSTDASLIDTYSAILEILEDYPKAILVLTEYLKQNPNNQFLQFKLAVLYYKAGDFSASTKILDSLEDNSKLPLDFQFLIVHAYIQNKEYDKAMGLSYDIRKSNIADPSIHGRYIKIQTAIHYLEQNKIFPPTVVLDSYVQLVNQTGKTLDYVLVERQKYSDEIAASEPFAQQLLGKAVGDKIEAGDDTLTVNTIMHKNVHALHDSMDQISTRFTDDPIKVMKFRADRTAEENLSRIFGNIEGNIELNKKLTDLYKDGKTTLGVNARLSGLGFINYWRKMASTPEIGIYSVGNQFETQTALHRLSSGKGMILDITAILGMIYTDLLPKLKGLSNEIYVSRSTYDLIIDEITDLRSNLEQPSHYVNKIGGQYIRIETTPEQKKVQIDILERAKITLDDVATIVNPDATNDFKDKQRKDLVLGKPFNESALIATQKDLVLISDDVYFRMIFFNESRLNGTSTINLIAHLINEKILVEEETGVYLEKYIELNYRHVPVNEKIILSLCQKAGYSVAYPMINGFDILNPTLDDLQATKFVGNTIYALFQSAALPPSREFIVQFMLSRFFIGRDARRIKQILTAYLSVKLKFVPLYFQEIVEIMQQF